MYATILYFYLVIYLVITIMYIVIYKGLICYRVFFMGLGAMALIGLVLAWVWATHHTNS